MPAINHGAAPNVTSLFHLPGYQVLEEILRDGSRVVYRGRNIGSGIEAEIHCFAAVAPERLSTWESEIAVVQDNLCLHKRCNTYSSIQSILDYGMDEGNFFVAFEHLQGVALGSWLRTRQKLGLDAILPIFEQLAGAIDYMAAAGLAHTRLTPESVLVVGPNDRICIIGFPYGPSMNISVSAFTAPELLSNSHADARADIYSMGAILFQCLAGTAPFTASSNEELIRKIGQGFSTRLTTQPRYVQDVLLRLMSFSPSLRYPVAIDAVQDLINGRSPEFPTLAVVRIIPSVATSGAATAGGHELDVVLPAQTEAETTNSQPRNRSKFNSSAISVGVALQESMFAIKDFIFGGFRRLFRLPAIVKEEDIDAPGRYRRIAPISARRLRTQTLLRNIGRFTFRCAMLILVMLMTHSLYLATQQRYTIVKAASGHPIGKTVVVKAPLLAGDKIDVAAAYVIAADKSSSVDLDYGGVRVLIEPTASVTLKPIQYDKGPSRSIELLQGPMRMDVGMPGSGLGSLLIANQGVRIHAREANFECVVKGSDLRVTVDQGEVLVSSGRYKKRIAAGYSAEIMRNRSIVTSPITDRARRHRLEKFPVVGKRSFVRRMADEYIDAQQQLIVPSVSRALVFCHMSPGSKGSLDDTQALIKARMSLTGLCKGLMLNGEPPVTLNLSTLEELGLASKPVGLLLNSFEGHRVTAYYPLGDDKYILFCRANDSSSTLLEANTGNIVTLTEENEAKAFADADRSAAMSALQ